MLLYLILPLFIRVTSSLKRERTKEREEEKKGKERGSTQIQPSLIEILDVGDLFHS